MFKSWHNFKIKRLNGEIIDLYEAGIMVMGFSSPTPSPEIYQEEMEGLDGSIDLGATLPGRTAEASFYIEARDYIAHSLQTDRIYKIFDSREPFYIIRDAQPGKQLLVRKSGGFAPSVEASFYGEFNISFQSSSPYWESVADTLEPVNFSSELWAVGMGFDTALNYQYSHNAARFDIHNPGDVVLDPAVFGRPLVFEFTGASTNLKIENKTTGETWSYAGTTTAGNVIKLDGVRSFKNGSSIFGSTNRGLLKLIKGRNDILITGATGAYTFKVISKFYYL